jgi:hypothetical protein
MALSLILPFLVMTIFLATDRKIFSIQFDSSNDLIAIILFPIFGIGFFLADIKKDFVKGVVYWGAMSFALLLYIWVFEFLILHDSL